MPSYMGNHKIASILLNNHLKITPITKIKLPEKGDYSINLIIVISILIILP